MTALLRVAAQAAATQFVPAPDVASAVMTRLEPGPSARRGARSGAARVSGVTSVSPPSPGRRCRPTCGPPSGGRRRADGRAVQRREELQRRGPGRCAACSLTPPARWSGRLARVEVGTIPRTFAAGACRGYPALVDRGTGGVRVSAHRGRAAAGDVGRGAPADAARRAVAGQVRLRPVDGRAKLALTQTRTAAWPRLLADCSAARGGQRPPESAARRGMPTATRSWPTGVRASSTSGCSSCCGPPAGARVVDRAVGPARRAGAAAARPATEDVAPRSPAWSGPVSWRAAGRRRLADLRRWLPPRSTGWTAARRPRPRRDAGWPGSTRSRRSCAHSSRDCRRPGGTPTRSAAALDGRGAAGQRLRPASAPQYPVSEQRIYRAMDSTHR